MKVTLRARLVVPIESATLRDGFVTIDGERIVAVGTTPGIGEAIDLGNVAILPGLINAHTHLEFRNLKRPLGTPGMAFPDWIREVITSRRGSSGDCQPHLQGLRECLASGTTTIAEIATTTWWEQRLLENTGQQADSSVGAAELLPETTLLWELIGLSPTRIAPKLAEAREHLYSNRPLPHRWRTGLCPHAPYTVHPSLLSQAVEMCEDRQTPIAFHLAESREELELLDRGSGPFRQLLDDLGAWDSTVIPAGTRPMDYLRILNRAKRALVIHGNYLDQQEIQFLANNAERFTLVYCPRTHHFFRHDPYPLRQILDAGIPVALGTDSRASNPDLNLFAEMRFVAQCHPHVSVEEVLRMGTIAGARALGVEEEVGSLVVGKFANLCLVELPNQESPDVRDQLFQLERPIVATWLAGCAVK